MTTVVLLTATCASTISPALAAAARAGERRSALRARRRVDRRASSRGPTVSSSSSRRSPTSTAPWSARRTPRRPPGRPRPRGSRGRPGHRRARRARQRRRERLCAGPRATSGRRRAEHGVEFRRVPGRDGRGCPARATQPVAITSASSRRTGIDGERCRCALSRRRPGESRCPMVSRTASCRGARTSRSRRRRPRCPAGARPRPRSPRGLARAGLARYAERHDDLASDATSRLSPYLHFGCLSPRRGGVARLTVGRARGRSSASCAGATSTIR